MQTIEVYADIACPFAHAGLLHFVSARQERELTAPLLRVRAWPLEVVNGKSFHGPHLQAEIDALRASVTPDLFAGFDAARFPTTSVEALAAEAAAHRVGPEVGERFSLAARHALWEEGLDISDADVLARLLEDHGVPPVDEDDRSAVTADHTSGVSRVVKGSPHFFTKTADYYCPGLDIDHEGRNWNIAFDRPAFVKFAADAFA